MNIKRTHKRPDRVKNFRERMAPSVARVIRVKLPDKPALESRTVRGGLLAGAGGIAGLALVGLDVLGVAGNFIPGPWGIALKIASGAISAVGARMAIKGRQQAGQTINSLRSSAANQEINSGVPNMNEEAMTKTQQDQPIGQEADLDQLFKGIEHLLAYGASIPAAKEQKIVQNLDTAELLGDLKKLVGSLRVGLANDGRLSMQEILAAGVGFTTGVFGNLRD